MEEEYLVLQCPACERNVKVRSNAAGTRLGCPYCKEPIEVTESDPEEVPLDEPVERPPLEFRRIQEADAVVDSSANSSSGNQAHQAGGKRKRRKRQIETPDWDEEVSPGAPRRGSGDSDLEGDSSEFLEMDPNSPGSVRLKRVRRKKILGKKEKFIRGLTLVVLGAAFATAAVVIYTAVVRTWEITQQDKETLENQRDIVPEPVAEDPGILKFEEEVRAAAVVEGFLNAKSVEDRIPFVRDIDRVEPLMREWYANNEARTEWPDGEVERRKKIVDQGRYFIILAIDFVGIGKRIFAVEQTQDVFKLDWETAIGYQRTPLAEFKAKRPTTPSPFRAKLKPSDYYNFEFNDPALYHAVELSYPGRDEFKLIGYINRTREWAPALIERLENGEAPSLIIELQYPSSELKSDSQVEIMSIVSESWWL